MGVFEAGVGQPEVIKTMIQRYPGDGDAKVPHVGEVRDSGTSRLVHLPEDDLLFVAMDGAPSADPALKGAADAGSKFGMTSQNLFDNGDGSQTGRRLQHRHNLGVKD